MNKDQLYSKILTHLDDVTDGNLFEACVCDLLRPEWPNMVPVPGGSDDGMDGAWSNADGSGILIATTNSSVIGNVTRNLKQYLAKGWKGKQVLVATTRKLSPTQAKNIQTRIRQLGFIPAHQPYERQAIADRLYHNTRWLNELLGLSGLASALSKIPKGLRPLRDIPFVGRELDLKWLKETSGDRLIVGQPGSGKTFLCQALVDEGKALFVTDDRITSLADAIRDQSPTSIILEDSHIRVNQISDLRNLREQIGAQFQIIAECWPGGVERVQSALGISTSKVRVLAPLSSVKIAELIKGAGLLGPNWLLRQIVRQSVGCPGRAALLVHFCRTDQDLEEVYTGRALFRWVNATFTDLVGDRVKSLLAAFAIGGEAGMSVRAVSELLRFSDLDINDLMSKLAHGGIVHEVSVGVLCVLPEHLRSALIADFFFDGLVKALLQPFIERSESRSSVCKALIASQARGASISSRIILDILRTIPNGDVWEHFIWSSEANARRAYHENSNLPSRHPTAFLHRAPELVLSQLLNDAIGDVRELHSYPDHPLRRIQDWVNSADPGTGTAFERRQVLWNAIKKWRSTGGNISICLRALESVLSPAYRANEQDPGDANTLYHRFGCVTAPDLMRIATLWPEVLLWLSDQSISDWSAILQSISNWVHPGGFGGSLTGEHYEIFKTTSIQVLKGLTGIAAARWGVLVKLRDHANYLDTSLAIEIDLDFTVLYPTDPYREDDEQRLRIEHEQSEAVRRLASQWSTLKPSEFAKTFMSYVKEAGYQRRMWPDHSDWACSLVAEVVDVPESWLTALIAENAHGSHILPFLRQIANRKIEGWLNYVVGCLNSKSFTGAAVVVLLALPDQAEPLETNLFSKLKDWPKLVSRALMEGTVSIARTRRLLSTENIELKSETVEGIWQKSKGAGISVEILDVWREAVIHGKIPDYYLSQIFVADNKLACDWLLDRTTRETSQHFDEKDAIPAAVSVLSLKQKQLILERASDEIFFSQRIVAAIVGDDLELYRWFLGSANHESLRLAPLRRKPTVKWAELAEVALSFGETPDEIVHTCFRKTSGSMGTVSSKYETVALMWGELMKHKNPQVIELAKAGERLCDNAASEWRKRQELEDFQDNYTK